MVRLNTGWSAVEILVPHEIALPFELHDLSRIGRRDVGLNPCVRQNFQRLRIEVGREIRRIGPRVVKQRTIEPDFRWLRPRHREPMHGRLDLAAIGRIAASGGGIVGTAQLDDFAGRILHHLATGDEIRVAQPDFVTRRQSEELLRRIFHEIVALDIELPSERHATRARVGSSG